MYRAGNIYVYGTYIVLPVHNKSNLVRFHLRWCFFFFYTEYYCLDLHLMFYRVSFFFITVKQIVTVPLDIAVRRLVTNLRILALNIAETLITRVISGIMS